MRPFLITFTLTAAVAAALWWQQRSAIAGLRAELNSAPAVAVTPFPAREKNAARKSAIKRKEPKVALRKADGSPVVTSHSLVRGALQAAEHLRSLSRIELEALLKSGEPDDLGEAAGMSLAIWSRLGELDPQAALTMAANGHEEGFYVVLHDWLIRDRAAALAWFHEQADSEMKASFMGVAGMVLAGSDPELLGQLTGSIKDPDIQRKSLTQSLIAQGMTDVDGTLARFHELPDDDSRAEVLLMLLNMHGDKRPKELLELALALGEEREGIQNFAAMMLEQFGKNDPQAALDWIASRPEKEIARLREHSRGMNLASLGKLDTDAVLAAAKNQPPAQHDWLLANHYAGRPLDDPPALLNELTAGIGDADLRASTVQHILSRCVRDGRDDQLEPWIASQPAKDQAAIREQIGKWKQEMSANPEAPALPEFWLLRK